MLNEKVCNQRPLQAFFCFVCSPLSPPQFFDFTIVANVCKKKSPNFEKKVKSSPHFNADLVWQPF